MDAVPTGVGADQEKEIAVALGPGPLQLVGADHSHAHRVDQRVVGVAILEVDLATDGGDADAVPVAADPAHHALEEVPRRGQRTETQRVEDGHRSGAHGGDVAQDPAHTGGRALVGLDGARVVVGLDLESDGPALADLDDAGVLARALQYPRAGAGQAAQEGLGGLVRAVLRPEHADHPQLHVVGGSAQQLDDGLVFGFGQSHLAQLLCRHRGTQTTSSAKASSTDLNRRRPSVPPSSGSAHRSGWGIMPSTFPSLFTIPAMLWMEPLGFAAGTT